jgi:hypothetical protein
LLYSRYVTSLSPATVEIVAVFSVYLLGSKTRESPPAAADEEVVDDPPDVDEPELHPAVTPATATSPKAPSSDRRDMSAIHPPDFSW